MWENTSGFLHRWYWKLFPELFIFFQIFIKSEAFLHLGSASPFVRSYEIALSVNLGILELTYWLRTFRNYSFINYIPFKKWSNSIIKTRTSVCPFKHSDFLFWFLTFSARGWQVSMLNIWFIEFRFQSCHSCFLKPDRSKVHSFYCF